MISSAVWDRVFMYFSRVPMESGQLVTSLLQSTIVQREGKGGGGGWGVGGVEAISSAVWDHKNIC